MIRFQLIVVICECLLCAKSGRSVLDALYYSFSLSGQNDKLLSISYTSKQKHLLIGTDLLGVTQLLILVKVRGSLGRKRHTKSKIASSTLPAKG